MVESYTVSPDKLTYTFVLRPGLKWHDGQPVTAADCVASIRRWASRDSMGQTLTKFTGLARGGRRQHDQAGAEGAVRAGARQPRQGRRARAVHDAGAHRQDAGQRAGEGDHRLRSLQVPRRPARAGREDRPGEVRRLQAAQRAAQLGLRRQDRQARPDRDAGPARRADPGERADPRRGRLSRARAGRPAAVAGRQVGRQGRGREQVRLPGDHAHEPPAAAVRQSQGAPGHGQGGRPLDVRRRGGGRSRASPPTAPPSSAAACPTRARTAFPRATWPPPRRC